MKNPMSIEDKKILRAACRVLRKDKHQDPFSDLLSGEWDWYGESASIADMLESMMVMRSYHDPNCEGCKNC